MRMFCLKALKFLRVVVETGVVAGRLEAGQVQPCSPTDVDDFCPCGNMRCENWKKGVAQHRRPGQELRQIINDRNCHQAMERMEDHDLLGGVVGDWGRAMPQHRNEAHLAHVSPAMIGANRGLQRPGFGIGGSCIDHLKTKHIQ